MRRHYCILIFSLNVCAWSSLLVVHQLQSQKLDTETRQARAEMRKKHLPIFDEPMLNYQFALKERTPPQTFPRVFEQRDILVDDHTNTHEHTTSPEMLARLQHQEHITANLLTRIAWETNNNTCDPDISRPYRPKKCSTFTEPMDHDYCPVACPRTVSAVQAQCPALSIHSSMENDGTCERGDAQRVCMSVSSLADVHLQYFSYEGLDFFALPTPALHERSLGFMASFVSNCVGWRRDALLAMTSALEARGKTVHHYGRCVHNTDENTAQSRAQGRDARKNDIGKRHRYTFAFENSERDGYVTEKLFYLLTAGAVPVYRGAPDVRKYLPSEEAAVVVDGSKSPEAIAAALAEESDAEYTKRLAWREQGPDLGWLSNMDLGVWHSTCRLCVHVRSMEMQPPESGIWVRERGFLEFVRVEDHVWQRASLAEILVGVSAAVESRLSEAERKTRPRGVGAVVRIYRVWDRQKCSLLSYDALRQMPQGSELEVVLENPGWTRRKHVHDMKQTESRDSIYGMSRTDSMKSIQKTGVSKCVRLDPNDSGVPNEGKYFLFDKVSVKADDQAYVIVQNCNMVDALFADLTGSFNMQPKDKTVVIKWKHDTPPLWIVAYGKDSSVFVKYTIVMMHSEHSQLESNTCPSSVLRLGVNPSPSNDVIGPTQYPFWKKRVGSTKGLVTLCTQLTVERIERLQMMAENYNGPISAVIYVGFRSLPAAEYRDEKLKIESAWMNSKFMQEHVDVHLVFDGKNPWIKYGDSSQGHSNNPYPVNLLRQLSVRFSQTNYILYLEADMIPRPRLHDSIVMHWEHMLRIQRENKGMLAVIVPVYNAPAGGIWKGKEMGHDLQKRVSSSKFKLRQDLENSDVTGLVRMSQIYSSHQGIPYDRWERLEEGDFLEVGSMQGNEPYFIIEKGIMPAYDVLFWGMTGDKVEQVEDVTSTGVKFVVHPDAWAVHFDSMGLGDEWITSERNWRAEFVRYMHAISKDVRFDPTLNVFLGDEKNYSVNKANQWLKEQAFYQDVEQKHPFRLLHGQGRQKYDVSDTAIGSMVKKAANYTQGLRLSTSMQDF